MSEPRPATRPPSHVLPSILGLFLVASLIPSASLAQARAAATSTSRPRLRFNQIRYASDGCVDLVLRDPAANADPGTPQEVPITVQSERGDSEALSLLETGPDTGQFAMANCLPIVTTTVHQNDSSLQVNAGDLIVAVETTAQGDLSAMDVALVDGGTDTGSVTIQIDPAIFPAGFPEAAPSHLPPPNDAAFPIGMVEDPQGASTFFGADQVIYQPANQTELNGFLDRHGGQVLNTLSVPAPAEEEAAKFSLIRLDPTSFDASSTAFLMEKLGFEGTYTFSSEESARLIGLLLEEQITGSDVAPSSLMLPMSAPRSNEGASNWFGQPWFDPNTPPTSRVKAGEGLTLMAVADHTTKVATAFIDGGFAGPNDYNPPFNNPDYGTSFNNASKCSFDVVGAPDCSPGAAAGKNPVLCGGWSTCDWHGLHTFSIAGARLDNAYGGAGTGAPAVSPKFYKTTYPFLFSGSAAIERATTDGAQVMNVGTGFRCRIIVDFCLRQTAVALSAAICAEAIALSIDFPIVGALACTAATTLLFGIVAGAGLLEAVVSYANAAGVVVVASAGNDGGDAAIDHMLPCTLSQVVCVGALDATASDLVAASFSDHGSAVDIWAPGVGVPVTPAPDWPYVGTVESVDGTSAAAAFVTGVVADIRSIDPVLTASQVRSVLSNTACAINQTIRMDGTNCTPSSDPLLSQRGYVDVLQAVRQARHMLPGSPTLVPCDGGWDELTAPADNYSAARAVNLAGAPAGSVLNVGGNLSIHALPTDRDWYRFQVPDFGAPTTDITVTLSILGPETGKLLGQLIKVTPANAFVLREVQTAKNGVATLRYLFDPGATYFLRVLAPTPESTNDACYSLRFLVHGPGPQPDRFEPNNSIGTAADVGLVNDSHIHASTTSSQSEEIWNKNVTGITFHVPGDQDYFQARLPDPQDPTENGHLGFLECGVHTGAAQDTVYEGEAVATPALAYDPAGSTQVSYFDPTNPTNSLFVPNGVVACPRDHLGSPFRLGISLSRPGATQPDAYDLDITYKIRVTTRVGAKLGKALGEHLNFLYTLVGKGGCMVPRCPPEKIDIHHVITPSQFGRCAPRCGELSLINLETTGRFDVTFSSQKNLTYQLLDRNMNVIMKGKPTARATGADGTGPFVKRMAGAIHNPGLYALRVMGPRGRYSLDIASMPTGQRDITIAAGSDRVRRGRRVRIEGALQSANPDCLVGSVLLQKKAPRQTVFRTMAKKSAAGSGSFSFFPKLRHTRDLRVVAPAAGACQQAISPTVRVRVK